MNNIKQRLAAIEQRNKQVELDKAWEISWLRRVMIVLLTYLTIVLFFYAAELPEPWLNAIIPATAFLISTLSLGVFKKIWLKSIDKL